MHNKSLIFVFLLSFLMTTLLSACGSKGDLYETPAPTQDESSLEKAEAKQAAVKKNETVEPLQKKQP